MDQAKKLSELISEIYDAALDPSLWSDVVGRAWRFVGGSTAAIVSKDPAAGSGNAHHESAIDPYYRELYCDQYAKFAPSTTGDRRAETGHLIAVADLMPNSWASPQGEARKCNVHDRTVMMNALAIKQAGACARAAM